MITQFSKLLASSLQFALQAACWVFLVCLLLLLRNKFFDWSSLCDTTELVSASLLLGGRKFAYFFSANSAAKPAFPAKLAFARVHFLTCDYLPLSGHLQLDTQRNTNLEERG